MPDDLKRAITCPLSLQIFTDPVILTSNFTVERAKAVELFKDPEEDGCVVCPFSRERISIIYTENIQFDFLVGAILEQFSINYDDRYINDSATGALSVVSYIGSTKVLLPTHAFFISNSSVLPYPLKILCLGPSSSIFWKQWKSYYPNNVQGNDSFKISGQHEYEIFNPSETSYVFHMKVYF
jgi:hypothetical protein